MGKTERRGGLAVYDHLELGRKLHSAQNAIDISGGTTPVVRAEHRNQSRWSFCLLYMTIQDIGYREGNGY